MFYFHYLFILNFLHRPHQTYFQTYLHHSYLLSFQVSTYLSQQLINLRFKFYNFIFLFLLLYHILPSFCKEILSLLNGAYENCRNYVPLFLKLLFLMLKDSNELRIYLWLLPMIFLYFLVLSFGL